MKAIGSDKGSDLVSDRYKRSGFVDGELSRAAAGWSSNLMEASETAGDEVEDVYSVGAEVCADYKLAGGVEDQRVGMGSPLF